MQKELAQQTHRAAGVGYSVAAWGSFHADVAQIDTLRQQEKVGNNPVAANFLRYADEQTVAGVVALNQTLARSDLAGTDFRRWGVLGCLQAPGRTIVGASLSRFATEGAWGVSPHIVPHRCLHSLSGTLSLGLKSEGPNFGVGEAEAVLPIAGSWLAQQRVEGVWAVITCMEPEYAAELGQTVVPRRNVAHAVVLALMPDQDSAAHRLTLSPTTERGNAPWNIHRLESWLRGEIRESWILPGGLKIERHTAYPRPVSMPSVSVSSMQEVRS